MTESRWWMTVFTKGISQKLDPQGLGYQSAMPDPLTPEQDKQLCDRHFNPGAISTEETFWNDRSLTAGGGEYTGPGYYLIEADGVARKVWGVGDKTQRPGEDVNAWKYRIGELQPASDIPDPAGNWGSAAQHAAHATKADLKVVNDNLILLLKLVSAK